MNAKHLLLFLIAEIIIYFLYVDHLQSNIPPDPRPEFIHKKMTYTPKPRKNTPKKTDTKPAEPKKAPKPVEPPKPAPFTPYSALHALGVYKAPAKKYFPPPYTKYNTPLYGFRHYTKYCRDVDNKNFEEPDRMFKKMKFVTDYDDDETIPREVMEKIGEDVMPKIARHMPQKISKSRAHAFSKNAIFFHMKLGDFHSYHKIGTHFLCISQAYNHIPGDVTLTRKNRVTGALNRYARQYENKTQCWQSKFFPKTYRLNIKSECKTFFKDVNSEDFANRSKIEPNQYVIKIGHGAHRGTGVFLYDTEWINALAEKYGPKGEKCGKAKGDLLAQQFISHPLLYNGTKKFDFRIYFFVASTRPLIAYYHDGFLKLSIVDYDPTAQTKNKNAYFTNTHFANEYFDIAKKNGSYNNMTEKELRDSQTQSLEQLQDYLLKSGKVTDKNWLENYLRPAFKKALAHLARAVIGDFIKMPNVYELFGVDFVLDESLQLWFIETNRSPQILKTSEYRIKLLKGMFEDLFEIEYALYRSRMKRIMGVLDEMKEAHKKGKKITRSEWWEKYEEAIHNKIDSEFKLSEDNNFHPIVDMNKNGAKAYFGLIEEDCI